MGCGIHAWAGARRITVAMFRRRSRFLILASFLSLVATAFSPVGLAPVEAASAPALVLPIATDYIDDVHWTDTWGAARSGGRSHVGVDMIGPQMTPLVAAADGVITWLRHDTSRGNILYLTDDNGWQYTYIHINNDSPGTDDGANRYEEAFGPGIELGARVSAGQVIAYMGDSGNAEWTVSHLHFEVVDPDGNNVNPAPLVDAALERALHPIDVDPAEVSPFADFDTFAERLYQTVHGRSGTLTERRDLADTVNTVGMNAALEDVITPNSTGASLDRLYEAYFLRAADTDGIHYWMDQYRGGASLTDIANWFAESDEFKNRYGGKPFGDFLDQLYVDVLHRAPDASGKAYWLGLLETGQLTRGSIVIQFTEGAEMINSTQRRTELTALSLIFTDATPSLALSQEWEALRSSSDLQSSLPQFYSLTAGS
ncbi:MAG: DUF4214 domain-containing protein [Acidimicrobiales bacterium]|nr:DUF4214 domain-containing protein [Acidimicrobiales bacterium]